MQIYFAAPLFSQAELTFNEQLTETLEADGHEVFLPQRDGIEIAELYEQPDIDDVADVMNRIFEIDRDAVYESDVLTAVLDGQVPDEGVAVEIGLAYENDVPIICLKTDRRTFSPDEPLNAMLWGAMDEYVETPAELVTAVNRRAENA